MGCDFRFVWPRGEDKELNDPTLLFDPGFLAAHEIAMTDLVGRALVRFDGQRTAAETRSLLLAKEAPAALETGECFNVLQFQDDSAIAAAARFREQFVRLGWSRNPADLIKFFDARGDGIGHHAIHIRAGDIVTGDWRSFMAYEKYVPLAFIERAIEVVSGPAQTPVLVMSDSPECVAHLRARYPQVRNQHEIYPGYSALGELDQAFADIVMMARSRTIVGPKRSAFSRLAANLGQVEFVEADRFAPTGGEGALLASWIERHGDGGGWLAPFVARDVCWYLDVFGDDIEPRRRLKLARRAAWIEPTFTAALARKAREAALLGRRKIARTAARQAVSLGQLATRHTDPMVDALSARIAAASLSVALDAKRSPRGEAAERRLRLLRQDLNTCKAMKPFQMRFAAILDQLTYQVNAAAWLASHKPGAAPPSLPATTAARGLAGYRSAETFDPVLADLETVSARLSELVATAGSTGKRRAAGRR